MKKYTSRVLSVLFLSLTVFGTSPVHATLESFGDVPQGTPYYDAVSYLYNAGIIQGYEDGTFRPYQTINRAEFVRMIMYQYFRTQEDTKNIFPDYPGGHYADMQNCFFDVHNEWFAPSICLAKEYGIVSGYPDGTFHPEQEISFAEAAKILSIKFDSQHNIYGSVPWYRESVEFLGEISAIPASIPSFSYKITRGEMAEMVYRVKAGITNKPSKTYENINLDTSNWQVYTNNQSNFSFKYPADWVVIEKS